MPGAEGVSAGPRLEGCILGDGPGLEKVERGRSEDGASTSRSRSWSSSPCPAEAPPPFKALSYKSRKLGGLGVVLTGGVDVDFAEPRVADQGTASEIRLEPPGTTLCRDFSVKCRAKCKCGPLDLQPKLPTVVPLETTRRLKRGWWFPKATLGTSRGSSTAFVKDKCTIGIDFCDGRCAVDLKSAQAMQGSSGDTLSMQTKGKIVAPPANLKAFSHKLAFKSSRGPSLSVAWQMKKNWDKVSVPLEAEAGGVKLTWEAPNRKMSIEAKKGLLLPRALEELRYKIDQSGNELRAKPRLLPELELTLTWKRSKPRALKSLLFSYEQSGVPVS
ncbi:hypothetical protein HOP50_05g39140 [Chloropicon primus]|uniref:Uncharacterized protein n=1 Tax=Chloropicon primus TaxID=1764295 RepID=A0A5B8MMV9_9CHLO|nr:hypothetical protein A3770_05p39020 [Chloropicon primus]UPR00599.1 hypothetical protein HOP50_05g39140 [Chloropicon primus]|eukprot:QDZ21384.1 hypothetical protein A3770_05p39020 [Chloropicon primus]